MPLVTLGIWVLGVCTVRAWNNPGVNVFEEIGLLADVRDSVHPDVATLKQPYGPRSAHLAAGVGALGFGMKLILADQLAVGLNAGGTSTPVRSLCYDTASAAGVLVDPVHLGPLTRIGLERGDQMETLRVCTDRMTQLLDVARQQKAKWLNLCCVRLTRVKVVKGSHDIWATNGDSANRRPRFEA